MKTIRKLLKQSRKLDGKTKVKLELHISLKKLRTKDKLLGSLGASKIKILDESKPAAKKAKPEASTKNVVKKAIERKKPAVKRKPTTAAKKPTKAKTAAKKAPLKKSSTAGVTQAAVLAAMGAKHSTPPTL